MSDRHSKATYQIKGMTCVGCELRIEKLLSKIEGIFTFKSNFSDSSLVVEYNGEPETLNALKAALEKAGYTSTLIEDEEIPLNPLQSPKNMDPKRNMVSKSTFSVFQLIGIAVIILAIYLLIKNIISFN